MRNDLSHVFKFFLFFFSASFYKEFNKYVFISTEGFRSSLSPSHVFNFSECQDLFCKTCQENVVTMRVNSAVFVISIIQTTCIIFALFSAVTGLQRYFGSVWDFHVFIQSGILYDTDLSYRSTKIFGSVGDFSFSVHFVPVGFHIVRAESNRSKDFLLSQFTIF